MIIDVAVTGIDGSSRRINDNPLQPFITRLAQKIQKYRRTVDQHGYQFIPFVFPYNGQALLDAVNFVRSQIDHKLRLVDGRATSTRRNSIWKLWVRYISVVINRTASMNIQRKITMMVNASNSTQRKAISSGDYEKDFLLSSSSAEELEQTNVDVLLLDQDVCQSQSQCADSQRFCAMKCAFHMKHKKKRSFSCECARSLSRTCHVYASFVMSQCPSAV